MKRFIDVAEKAAEKIRDLARMIESDDNIQEYFIEAYNYLDDEDAPRAAFQFIQDHFLKG